MAYEFDTLTAQQIKDYMDEHATAEQKKDFKKKAFVNKKEKVSKKVYSADGSPVMYRVMDKDGNPKNDKNGNPLMRQKIEMIERQDGKTSIVFSLLNAKWWFAEHFPEALIEVPERAEKKEAVKAGDIFGDW